MAKKIFILAIFILSLSACATVKEPPVLVKERMSVLEPFVKNERVLILAPHPDDESIACSGVIQQALAAGAKVKIVYLTNGDHNELAFIVYEKRITLRQGEFIHMGQVRRKEAIAAAQLLGLKESDLIFLGYPDFGTFTIFNQYWQARKPFRDRLTRISRVPYPENFSPGAPYQGESILNDLEKILREYRPQKIFCSHAADVNGDHKAFYLFLQVALSDLQGQIPNPKLYTYLVHCLDWPLPRYYHPQLELYPPEKFWSSQIDLITTNLSPEQLEQKYRAILCHRSQTSSSAFYLLAFARKNELFGGYPLIRLRRQVSGGQARPWFSGFAEMISDTNDEASTLGDESLENKGQVSYAVVDNCFLVRVNKPRELSRWFGVQVYIFGYSQRTPFARMPKIKIVTSGQEFKLFLNGRSVATQGVFLDLGKNTLVLKIPLVILGNPDYILTALRAFHGSLPIDAVSFRKIAID